MTKPTAPISGFVKGVLSAFLSLLLPLAACGVDTMQVPATSGIIPEVVTIGGERYSKVTVHSHSKEQIAFSHDSGVATRKLAEFGPATLELFFPGLAARIKAAEAEKIRIQEAPAIRLRDEKARLEVNLRKAIAEALATSEKEPGDPYVCILVSGHDTYEIGDQPQLAVRIVNRSSKAACLPGSLAGSYSGRGFPRCLIELVDPAGKPMPPPPPFCGTTGPLQASHFVTISPGQAFDPFGEGFFPSDPFYYPSTPRHGVVRLRFSYSTKSAGLNERLIVYPGDDPREIQVIQDLLDRTPRVEMKSNELTITFRPESR